MIDILAELRTTDTKRWRETGHITAERAADEIERLRYALKLVAIASGGPDEDGNNFIVETVEAALGGKDTLTPELERLRAVKIN